MISRKVNCSLNDGKRTILERINNVASAWHGIEPSTLWSQAKHETTELKNQRWKIFDLMAYWLWNMKCYFKWLSYHTPLCVHWKLILFQFQLKDQIGIGNLHYPGAISKLFETTWRKDSFSANCVIEVHIVNMIKESKFSWCTLLRRGSQLSTVCFIIARAVADGPEPLKQNVIGPG